MQPVMRILKDVQCQAMSTTVKIPDSEEYFFLVAMTATAITNQEKSLNFFAGTILDNRTAPDHILAEQGGVCSVFNASYCTLIK